MLRKYKSKKKSEFYYKKIFFKNTFFSERKSETEQFIITSHTQLQTQHRHTYHTHETRSPRSATLALVNTQLQIVNYGTVLISGLLLQTRHALLTVSPCSAFSCAIGHSSFTRILYCISSSNELGSRTLYPTIIMHICFSKA